MSNTWNWYAKGLLNIMNGTTSLTAGGTKRVMLCTSSYTPSKSTHEHKSDVTNEVSGTGYTARGLATPITVADSGTKVEIRITTDPAWSSSTITARHAVLYDDSGTDGTSHLIGYMTFGDGSPADVVSTNGTFTIDNTDSNNAVLTITY